VPADAPTAFFSYSREDLEFALRLAKDLKKAWANVWMDKLDIRPGQLWEQKAEEALENCARLLVILSPASVGSRNVMAEVAFALDEQKEVIPVLYRDCRIPFRLRPFQYVDFRTDYSESLDELLTTVAAEGSREAAAAAFVAAADPRSTNLFPDPSRHPQVSGWGPARKRELSKEESKEFKLRELHLLTGHSAGVSCLALSKDGALAVSASEDKTLKVWEVETGCERRTLIGHTGRVYGVALGPDGTLAVSASRDRTLKIWGITGGIEVRTLQGHSNVVAAVAVTTDVKHAISASRDQTLKIWDLVSPGEPHTLKGHTNWVNAVALTSDGQRVVSGSSDHTLKVWDKKSGRELRTLDGHAGGVYAVAVTPDGQGAVSASWDTTLSCGD
jgi:WD40 repeat protein